jgi:hypothetical protein
MKLYADLGPRRAQQIAGDLLLVLWVLVWVLFGRAVHRSVVALAAVGERLQDGGSDLAGNLGEAGRRAAGVPLVGDELRSPFDRAAGAARAVADAGRTQQEAVAQLGLLLGVATALVPIAVVALLWLPRRVAFARRAGATRRHLRAAEDLDLLALRAIAGQPMHRLARVSDDPAGAWRRREPDVVTRLAALELQALGLRVPERLQARVSRPRSR